MYVSFYMYTHIYIYIYIYVLYYMGVHIYIYIYICIHIHTAVNKLRESSAKVAAKGKQFYAKVVTFRRSHRSAILNNHDMFCRP